MPDHDPQVDFVRYITATGEITARCSCKQSDVGVQAQPGESVLVVSTVEISDLTHYVAGSPPGLVAKTAFAGLAIDKTTIADDGIDKATISGVPAGSIYWVRHGDNNRPTAFGADTTLEITSDVPEVITVEIMHPAHLLQSFTIVAS